MKSLEQSMDALARANKIRCGRAQAKREIRAGELTVVAALDREDCRSATVWELVMAQAHWGRSKTIKLMRGQLRYDGYHLQLPPYRVVGDLSAMERVALVEALS